MLSVRTTLRTIRGEVPRERFIASARYANQGPLLCALRIYFFYFYSFLFSFFFLFFRTGCRVLKIDLVLGFYILSSAVYIYDKSCRVVR